MRRDDLFNQQIQGFLVHEIIGKGGMATVYRATQQSIGRDVALKVIRLENQALQEKFQKRFAQEAKIIAGLEHPNIVPIYEYGVTTASNGVPVAFIAMRLFNGQTLDALMQNEALPLTRVIALFGDIMAGLAHAHHKGVLHRDLKPSNIMLDDNGTAYLADFGLARPIHQDSSIVDHTNIVGTPAYMSPEQLRRTRLDQRSDLYSASVLLYQMLTGDVPFKGDTTSIVIVMYQHLHESPPAPSQQNPQIPAALDAVLLKALAKYPEDRYHSAGALLNAVREAAGARAITDKLPTLASFMHSDGRALWHFRSSPVVPALLLMLVVMVLLGFISVMSNTTVKIRPQYVPTVIPNALTNAHELIVSDLDQRRAQAVLGEDGFIALIACNQATQYHLAITREMRDFANEYGLRTEVYDSDNDEARQVLLIEQARLDGAVGIILCPINQDLLHPVLEALDADDFPLVLFSSTSDDHYGGVVKRGDSFSLGYVPGQYAGRLIRDELGGRANVIILDFPNMPVIVTRANGLEAGVLEAAPNATVVGRFPGGTQENGYTSVKALLADGVAFDVIVSINDAGTYGAIRALEEAGVAPEAVIIVSIDADAQAQEYIRNGYYLRGSMGVERTNAAFGMVAAMALLLAGGTITEDILIVADETSMVTAQSLAEGE